MDEYLDRTVAIVGVGAIMPDAPDARAFWDNIKNGRYSISEVDPARWDPELYYDPDPKAPDKTYSKIGGWVREWDWDPRAWKLALMPRVAEAMDDTQKWAVACTHQALTDYGYPARPLDPERVAVILGNAMGGERHYQTASGSTSPRSPKSWARPPAFTALPHDVQRTLLAEFGRHHRQEVSRDHRGLHARRAVELHRRPGGQPVRLPRSQLRDRRRLRLGHGGDQLGGPRAGPRRLRRRHHRRHRPQHGRVDLRQVLQDRRPVGHRDPAVRRRRRRLRDGRGRRRCSSSSGSPTPWTPATTSTR